MIVLLALLSAFVFGSGVVLQRRAALEVPDEHAARPSLLIRLVQRPLWLLGLFADAGAFALQAAALHHGSLVVVQPLITTSLLFTLAITAAWYHEAISWAEWAAVLLVLAGLSVFLIVASPTEESTAAADSDGWLFCTGAVVLAAAVAVGAGLNTRGVRRAALFGVAAGIADAFMAVLAKALAGAWDHGVLALLRSWTPYALVAGGIVALLLVSTAYQAGHPTVSLPVITVTDPLVGCLVGILLFGEHLTLGGLRGPVIALAALAMCGGLAVLGRDKRLASMMVEESPAAVESG